MAKTRVAVIFGGMSNEHDISLISASNVIAHLDPDKYEIIPVGITKREDGSSIPEIFRA